MEELANGEARYRAGAFAEAAIAFRQICEAAPDSADAIRMLGLCELKLGRAAIGLELLTKARDLVPADPFAQLHYGLGLHAVGRHQEAAAQFLLCRPLIPDDPAPDLNRAAALFALGQFGAAFDAAQDAATLAPKLPQAHYMAGLALLALGRLDEAERAINLSLQLDSGLADAWVNLGIIRYRGNDIEGAKAAMQQALDIDPLHAGAAANLGGFMRLSGNVEKSEAFLREVLARTPDAAEPRLNLAVALLQEERAGEALTLLDGLATPREPRLAAHWLLQRLLALLQLNRLDEARAVMAAPGEPSPELAPLFAWRQLLFALADGAIARAGAHAYEMEQALASNAVFPEHRITGHFELAGFWSGQRENARAMAHWEKGHRTVGRFQPFSRPDHRALVDATIARFDRARLHDGPRARNRDPAPVFIVGMPRSGTTLAEQIIAAHRNAEGLGERAALPRAFETLGSSISADAVVRVAALETVVLDAAAENYLAELHALAPQAERIVDKMPGNFLFLGLAALMLPGARVIYCARDPRDIGLSIFTYRFYGYHPYAHDLADIGWYMGEHRRLMQHWQSTLPNPLMTVHLKDWVEDFDGTLRRVLDFLDLPYDPACERFYERDSRVLTVSRKQVRQPVNANGIGRWRAFEPQLEPLIAALTEAGVPFE